MIERYKKNVKFNVIGKVSLGCTATKGYCDQCKKDTTVVKPHDTYLCIECQSPAKPKAGAPERPKATPFFILPKEVMEKLHMQEFPTVLSVIPANDTVERTFPNSYQWKIKGGNVICKGNGITATRYNAAQKTHQTIDCSEQCPEYTCKPQKCKMSGTLYAVLPDIDVMNAFRMTTHSPQSIENIISTLNKLTDRTGKIIRQKCTLKITRVDKPDKQFYYIVEMIPPSISEQGYKKLLAIPYLDNTSSPAPHPGNSPTGDDKTTNSLQEEGTSQPVQPPAADLQRIIAGRAKVKEKARQRIPGDMTDHAIEELAKRMYAKDYEDLTLAQLTEMWHLLNGNGQGVSQITAIIKEMSQKGTAQK